LLVDLPVHQRRLCSDQRVAVDIVLQEKSQAVGVRYCDQLVNVGFFLRHAERKITNIAVGIGIHVVCLDSVETFLLAEGDPVGHDGLERFVAR
jgi:hypothetical protein